MRNYAFLAVLGLSAIILTGCTHQKSPSQITPVPGEDISKIAEKIESPKGAQKFQTTKVEIKGFTFTPSIIEVKKGTTVTFTNFDSVGHTVTADDGSFDTPTFKDGTSQPITFDKVGTFSYYCRPHPYMKGKVIVAE